MLLDLVSCGLSLQGVTTLRDHLPPKVSPLPASLGNPLLSYCFGLSAVFLLSHCVLEKQSYGLKPPILHTKFDIFSPNVNLYLIVFPNLTLLH